MMKVPAIIRFSNQLASRRAWVVQVPWLPDSVDEHERFGLESFDRSYLNLAEAVASASADGAALQLRIHGNNESGIGLLSAWVMGFANSEKDAISLWHLVYAALPRELPFAPLEDYGEIRKALDWGSCTLTEVRRRIEEASPRPGVATVKAVQPTVLRWDVVPSALRTAMALLQKQRGRSSVVLHMERAIPTQQLLLRLSSIFGMTEEEKASPTGGEYGPLLDQIANESRDRLRVLPRGALHVRVMVASTEEMLPGLSEAVGMDLTSLGGFELAKPVTPDERMDSSLLLTEGIARHWQPYGDPVIEDLRYIADPEEAAAVVRFPQPPRGGIPGMHSVPMMTLPKSPQLPVDGDTAESVRLGTCPYGGAVRLTLGELNQHCLIAGLPGFGKTNTAHTILRQLWNEHKIPFLVLDPAKSDYAKLVPSLVVHDGKKPQRVVLTPQHMAFNPFVVPSTSTPATHAARVLGAFDAALQLSASWPLGYIILNTAVFRAYEICEHKDGMYPTLQFVQETLAQHIISRFQDSRTLSEVSASLVGRIVSMARGPLGNALLGASDAGIDWEDLLSRPTVVELRGFAGPTERSLIFGLLIAGLASYLEGKGPADHLKHVTVLEEAHRVLSNRGGVEAEGVRLLAEAIAELRGSGEGFLVVDQTPTSLHPVIRKVCGSLISHRLVEKEERETIGAALLLDERQTDDLARLPKGRAVVYGAARDTSVVADIELLRTGEVEDREDPLHTLVTGGIEPLVEVNIVKSAASRTKPKRQNSPDPTSESVSARSDSASESSVSHDMSTTSTSAESPSQTVSVSSPTDRSVS